MSARDCPCSSGAPYADCCAPYHRGEREPPDAETLMRSRYAAYAKRQAPYIYRTLHADHEDRARSEVELMREIRDATSNLRFMGLQVLDRRAPDERGIARVLFAARVFEKGQNRSFVELSDFAHDGVGWRYLRGRQEKASRFGADPRGLTIGAFEAVIAQSPAP
jgi:SEC-C motif-containing protein